MSAPVNAELAKRFVGSDLTVPDFVLNGAKTVLKTSASRFSFPRTSDSKRCRLEEINFVSIQTLIFASVNEAYHRRVPVTHSSLSPAYLLSQFLTARKILEDGARDECEMAVAPVYAALISFRVSDAFGTRVNSENQIQTFQDLIFDNGRSLSVCYQERARFS